jgi:DNA-binding NarL/FixJ family response regulator
LLSDYSQSVIGILLAALRVDLDRINTKLQRLRRLAEKRITKQEAKLKAARRLLQGPAKRKGFDQKHMQGVLLGITQGRTNQQIGQTLGISKTQVKRVIRGLFENAGVTTRAELAAHASKSQTVVASPQAIRGNLDETIAGALVR